MRKKKSTKKYITLRKKKIQCQIKQSLIFHSPSRLSLSAGTVLVLLQTSSILDHGICHNRLQSNRRLRMTIMLTPRGCADLWASSHDWRKNLFQACYPCQHACCWLNQCIVLFSFFHYRLENDELSCHLVEVSELSHNCPPHKDWISLEIRF